MKYIIAVLFALFAFASATTYRLRTQADVNLARRECIEAHNVTAEHINNYQTFNFPDDETTRCYIECVYEKLDFFNPEDGFNTQNIITQLTQNVENRETITAAITTCVDNNDQESDSCTWAFRAFQCYRRETASLNVE